MRKSWKKYLIALSVLTYFVLGSLRADESLLFGGIKREELANKKGTFVFEELCFMTGEPVLLRGTVVIPPKNPEKDEYSVTLKYALASADKNIKLDRSVTYDVVNKKNPELNQVISNWTVKSGGIKETVSIEGEVFTLSSYEFDNSMISDLKPAGQFDNASLHYKKVFHTAEPHLDEGKKISITGDSQTFASYKNFWSGVNSTKINQKIEFETLPGSTLQRKYGPKDGKKPEEKNTNWQADVIYSFSEKIQSKFDYVKHGAKNTSFRKGLLKSTNYEYNVSYDYNLPSQTATAGEKENGQGEKAPDTAKRKTGKIDLDAYRYDSSTMLPIPKYNDVAAHWAEESIFKMASLGGFDLDSSFFPDVTITRAQFARAILNAIDSVEPESPEKRKTEFIKSQRKGAKELPFDDVRRDSEYYVFVEAVNEREMMFGEGDRQFLPNRPLTREEAITIMIRSLGVDDVAPSLPFETVFLDDDRIAGWAKPSIYQAVDFGIIDGYEDGTIKPKKLMTRAEASQMLVGYIEHMRKEIPKDYKRLLQE